MPIYRFIVLTDPTPGQDQAYNDWYTNQHIHDVIAVPGFVAAQRFKVVDVGDGIPERSRYLAIYEVDVEDPKAAIADLRSRRGSPLLPLSDALDTSRTIAQLYEPITARVTANAGS